MEGWIKLYRKFCEWEWFNISEMVHLFIYLLLNANHEDGSWKGINIKRGQILTGLNVLHQKTGISIRTLRTCLDRLEKTKEIDRQTTNKYSIISICNYDCYQGLVHNPDSQTDKQPTSNRQATDKQPTTNNNEKNVRRSKRGANDHTSDSINFYTIEATKAKEYPDDPKAVAYLDVARHICQKENGLWSLPFVLKIEKQISLDNFIKLYDKANGNIESITTKIDSIQNKVKYHDEYMDLYRTINTWFNNDK